MSSSSSVGSVERTTSTDSTGGWRTPRRTSEAYVRTEHDPEKLLGATQANQKSFISELPDTPHKTEEKIQKICCLLL